MYINNIQVGQFANKSINKTQQLKQSGIQEHQNNNPYKSVPLTHTYNANISFGEDFNKRRTIPHIDFEEYMAMTEPRKEFFRRKYKLFTTDKSINKGELFDTTNETLPLRTERSMDEFIKTAKIYNNYKDQPIICLGRSPKWFLNASLWMKDGIEDYKFVAFSKFWYRKDPEEGVRKIRGAEPTEAEAAAYKKYLQRIKADPKTIVDTFDKTGKKTVITDYICSGKGATSFLDIMSKFAEEDGILEKFSKSIEFVGIGSMDYMEKFYHEDECISEPQVFMPERLIKYEKNIKQKFYDMDYDMFSEMLLNQNTNECRSTYYPHEAWTLYKPDRFKVGLVSMKTVEKTLQKSNGQKSVSIFTPAMFDYRNLLNFRILDGLNSRDLLKATHRSKV